MDRNNMISIIIPVYNVEKYIERCLKSVLNQTYSNLEIIVINDGSTDNTGIICERYAGIDSRIKYIYQQNQGVSAARNKGLSLIKGEYLIFVDSDDWLELNCCEILLNTICRYSTDVIFFEMIKHYSEKTKKPYKLEFQKKGNISDIIKCILVSDTKLGGGYIFNKFYRVENRENLPKFKNNLSAYEDKLWLLEYLQKCQSVLTLDKVLYNYEVRLNSLSNSCNIEEKRWIETILAYKYMTELFEDNILFSIARNQYLKKIVQSIFWKVSKGKDKTTKKLMSGYTVLKGNYKYIYRDSKIRFSTKIKTLWIQILEKYYQNMEEI